MALKTISAAHKCGGTWQFNCPLHGTQTAIWRIPSTPDNALVVIKDHVDSQHPGVKVRILINGKFATHTTYTGTETINPGELL